jgi:hypothetical protein
VDPSAVAGLLAGGRGTPSTASLDTAHEARSHFSGFCSSVGDIEPRNPNNSLNLECGPGDAAGPKRRMLERLLDMVVLTVVAILFSVAVAVLKYRKI